MDYKVDCHKCDRMDDKEEEKLNRTNKAPGGVSHYESVCTPKRTVLTRGPDRYNQETAEVGLNRQLTPKCQIIRLYILHGTQKS